VSWLKKGFFFCHDDCSLGLREAMLEDVTRIYRNWEKGI
jgi:hypothetical protein